MARALCAEADGNWIARNYNETPSGEDPEDMRAGYRAQAAAVLSAIEAMGAVVVPVEATEGMSDAGFVRLCDHTSLTPEDVYTVMITASPFAKGSTDDK
jgi:hypothetical protein